MQSREGCQTAARRVQRGTLCQSATARGEESPRETRVCRRGRVRCSATMCVTDVHCAPSALCVDRLGLLGAPLTDEKMRSSPHYTRQSPRRPSTARGAGPPRAAGSGLRILVFSPLRPAARPAACAPSLASRRPPRAASPSSFYHLGVGPLRYETLVLTMTLFTRFTNSYNVTRHSPRESRRRGAQQGEGETWRATEYIRGGHAKEVDPP
jgi:hypothetical protein